MSGSVHPKSKVPSDKDLTDNPGIGTSKGTSKATPEDAAPDGENTFEGDVENDTTPAGGVNRRQQARTNK